MTDSDALHALSDRLLAQRDHLRQSPTATTKHTRMAGLEEAASMARAYAAELTNEPHVAGCTCGGERYGPGCAVHVSCDHDCRALNDPQTVDELRAAYEHWRDHGYLSGCAHGC